MKKFIFIITATIIIAGCTGKSSREASHPLIGMWQYCQPMATEDESIMYTHRPIYKIIGEDDSYFVSAGSMTQVEGMQLQEIRAIITQRGRYEIINDSVYHELIDIHNHKPLCNTVSVINYKFADEDKEYLHINFKNNETGVSVSEVWRRVKFVENYK